MTQTNPNHSETAGTTPEFVPLGYPPTAPTPPKFEARSSIPGYQPPATPVPGAPLPHRPKGRFFIAALLVTFLGGTAFYFYDSYVRYVAYGQVVGRKIELAPPWAGVVTALHVRVGDTVRQGDPLFNVDSIKMRHRMEQIEDSLNLQRARLASELARLKWEAERVEDTQQLVRAEYYEKWSELLWEESVLSDLQQQLARGETLILHQAIAAEKLESIRCRVAGQSQRIEQLSKAVQSLQRRLETDRPIDPNLNDQIKPSLVNIENLQAELRRTRQLLDQGIVASPANGRVTHITKYSGEYVEDSGSVIELFVDGSAEIVLYLPQANSQHWSTGDSLDVRIEPAASRLTCEVTRVAPEMQGAPKSITRHYAANEILLPIVLRPTDPKQAENLVLGSKVRLPRANTDSGLGTIAAWLRGDGATATLDTDPVSPPCQTVRDRVRTSAFRQTLVSTYGGHESDKIADENEEATSDNLLPTDVRPSDSKQAEHLDLGGKVRLLRANADFVFHAIAAWLRGDRATETINTDPTPTPRHTVQQGIGMSALRQTLVRTCCRQESDTFAIENGEGTSETLSPVVVRPADPKQSEKPVAGGNVRVPPAKADAPFRTIAARLRGDGVTATIDTAPVLRPRRTLQERTIISASGQVLVRTSCGHESDTFADQNGNGTSDFLLPVFVPPD